MNITNYGILDSGKDMVFDGDGNPYTPILIGTQTWLKENLKATKFNDGTTVSISTGFTDFVSKCNSNTATYCHYNWDSGWTTPYGLLYNQSMVNSGYTTKNICPVGYHVPSKTEWETLFIYLGGYSDSGSGSPAGKALRETGTSHWSTSYGSTNSSKFTGLASGYLYSGYTFLNGPTGHTQSFYWTTTPGVTSPPGWFDINIDNANPDIQILDFRDVYGGKKCGFSIRCIKD